MNTPSSGPDTDLERASELIRDAAKSVSRVDDLSRHPLHLSAATRGALIRVLRHDLAQIERTLPVCDPYLLADEIAAFAELESQRDPSS